MCKRLGMLAIESIEELGLPQPDIAVSKVRLYLLSMSVTSENIHPQLCLLVAIMRVCRINRCRYVRTLGDFF
jgi:hypothetical protein